MADDSDSNNAESNRRSIADRLSFFENISKIQDTSQQPGRVSTDHDLEETPDNIPIATSRSDHSGEPLKDKDSDEKIGEDDSVFKTENDTIVQNKEDEDEKEDNMTKEKKWDKGNIELEKEVENEDQLKEGDEWKQEENMLVSETSDDEDKADKLQPLNSEDMDNLPLAPEEREQDKPLAGSEPFLEKENQNKSTDDDVNEENGDDNDDGDDDVDREDGDDDDEVNKEEDGYGNDDDVNEEGSENDDDDYDDAVADNDGDQIHFYDAVAEPLVGSPSKETDLWKTHSDEESDKKLWDCTGEPDGSEISRSEQKALWETTDDSFILINKNEDVRPEDVSVEIESKDGSTGDSKISHLHGAGFIMESENHDRADTHENCDYTLYENYENSLIPKENPDVYHQRWNSNSSDDEEDKFYIPLNQVVPQTNFTDSQSNSKVQISEQTDDESNDVDDAQTGKTEDTIIVSVMPDRVVEQDKSPELSEENSFIVETEGKAHMPFEEVNMINKEIDQSSLNQSGKSEGSGTHIPLPIKKDNKAIEGTENKFPLSPPVPVRKPSKPTELKQPSEKTMYQNVKPPPIPEKSYRSSMSLSDQKRVTENTQSPVSMASAETTNKPKTDIDRNCQQNVKQPIEQTIYQNVKPPPVPEKSYKSSMSLSDQKGVAENTQSPVSMASAETTNKPKADIDRNCQQNVKQPIEQTMYQNVKPPPVPDKSYRKSMSISDQRSVTESISSCISMTSAETTNKPNADIDRTCEQSKGPPVASKSDKETVPMTKQPSLNVQQQNAFPQQPYQQQPGFVDQNQMFCSPRYPYRSNPQWPRYFQQCFMPFPTRPIGPRAYYPPFNQFYCQPPPPPYPEEALPKNLKGDQNAEGKLKAETAKKQTTHNKRRESSNNHEAKSGDSTERQSGKTKVPTVTKKAPKKSEKAKKQLNGLVCVRGLKETTPFDTLCDFLDVVSATDVDRSGVLYSEDSKSAVVPFTEPIDFDKLSSGISKRKLDGSLLEVCKVEQPNCIIISCDKALPSVSTLKDYFELKRSGGGSVMKCEEKDGMHLIHFKESEAVVRVCEGTRNHKIEGGLLTVTPFYVTKFGDIWNQSKHKVVIPQDFEVTNIDPYVKQFITTSNKVIAEINETLQQKYARLSIIETLKIECLLSQKTPNIRQIVKTWNKEVKEKWHKFVEDVTHKIEICVTEEVWPDLMVHVKNIQEHDESKVIVFPEKNELKLIFVGYRNVVETFTEKVNKHKTEIEYKLDRIKRRETRNLCHKPIKVRLLKSTGALEELNRTIADDFVCIFDLENGEIQCTGVEADIVKAQLRIFELLSNFHTFDFKDLSQNQFKLLRANIVQEMIRKQLQSENKQVEFEVCDESKIIICMVDHMDAPSVKQMIQDMAVEDTIKLDEFSRNVPKKQIWVDTRSRVEKSNNGKLIIEVKDDKINITATKDIAHDVQKELRDVIVKNTILKETVSVPDVGKMKFIEKHCQDKFEDLEEDLNEESLQIRVLDNGIEISGTKLGLFKAQQLIGKLLSDIHHRQHDINKQSIGKVLSPEDTEIFNDIEETTTTVIIQNYIDISSGAGVNVGRQESVEDIDSEDYNKSEHTHDGWKHRTGKFSLERGPMPTMPTVSMATPTVSSQKGQVKCQNGTVIYLVKGELAKQQGDVIVCSTSKDLNLKAGKAGANILHEGGQSIQDELKKNYPQGIQHGVVAVSNGGNLKCKQIYFGSLYDWHHEKGKPVKTITTFMNNCLNKAHQSSYTSILFAALGTGALGYPRDEAAQLMYQSVMDFDKANPNSTLKTIKFILYPKDSLTMDAFEQEEMSYINPAMKKAIKKGPVTSKYGMKIFIEKGSLGQQQADVLVCATPRDLSLNSAAASKSLLQDGGESIQIECSQNYPNGIKDGEIAVVGGGNLSCQKLYLTTIPSWDIEKSKQVQDMVVYKVISSCLEKASKAKYKSVAIPAMGTGKVNYPRKNIAKLLYECVLKFSEKNSKSSIQTVKFVVFPKDMETVRAFEKEEQNRLCPQIKYSSGSSSVVTPKCNITISIDTSTLSSAKVDVIVCSTAPGLDLNSGQSSKALLEAGGKTLQDECIDNYGDGIDCGEVAIVGPGKLSCKKVFFGCLPKHSIDPTVAEKTLADFMKKCLTEADSAKMKTIAFSSLGTGGNGFPHNVAARTMYQAVFDFDKQHSSTSIKQVNFVIYSKDHKSIQAFQTEEKQHQPIQKSSGASTSLLSKILGFPSRRSSQNSDQTIHGDQDFAVGSMMLTFCVGDLLVQKVDAIVNSTNTDLDFSRGGISIALKEKCGQDLIDECSKKVEKMKQKKMVTTTGCGLPCKKIIHIDSSDSLKGWKKMMILCLKKAEKYQFTSIAFPLLGTGGAITSFKPESIAEIFYESVLEHSKGDNKHLKTVKVVVLKQDVATKMVSAVQAYQPKGTIGKIKDGLGNLGLIPKQGIDSEARIKRNEMMNSVSLSIFSDSDDNIDVAIDMLDDLVNKKIKQQTIKDTLIQELIDSEIQQIKAVGKKFQIKLEIDDQKGEIHVEGVQSDLVDAKDEIHKLLSHYQLQRHIDMEAKFVAESVQWYCKEITATGLNLVPYPPRLNLRFEDSMKKQLKNVEFMDPAGDEFILDLEKMKEFPKNDPSDECDVVRKELLTGENVELPAHWTNLKDQSSTVQLINVDSSSVEYKNLEQNFLNSVLNGKFKDRFSKASLKVKKIERVQNKSLYQQYRIKKKQMENQTPQGIQVERDLWHGTSAKAVDSINYYGFNRSYCGGAGHGDCWYGDGVYFSNDGSYSARAWLSQGHGPGAANIAIGGAQTGFTGQVYVAKVLTGDLVLGKKGMKYLPQKPTGNIYDCAVDNVQNPVEFIIFNDTQAYPEYILTFDT